MHHNSTGISEQLKKNMEAFTEALIMHLLQRRKLQSTQKVEEEVEKKLEKKVSLPKEEIKKHAKQITYDVIHKLEEKKEITVFNKGTYKHPRTHEIVYLPSPQIAPYGMYNIPIESERIAASVPERLIVEKTDDDFDKKFKSVHENVYFNVYECQEKEVFFIGREVYDASEASDGVVSVCIEKISDDFDSKEKAFLIMDKFIEEEIGKELEKDLENVLDIEAEELEEEIIEEQEITETIEISM
ncbi:hypothetical protein SAMN04488168_12318 [Bacillus sp. 491mf]|uniref:hypothetical protein n=1 Tax=Bacillus sp. 491mf TaxID=1761755 RepID=UPI0008EF921C|nr:hypothetical protein [Bacillus sp. 491mf]SFD18084.1 hypothetical protein SAMN04488168_12318 [Bacillus sp. 491mf]